MHLIMLCVKCGAKIKVKVHKNNKRFYMQFDGYWLKINPDTVYIICDECTPMEKER